MSFFKVKSLSSDIFLPSLAVQEYRDDEMNNYLLAEAIYRTNFYFFEILPSAVQPSNPPSIGTNGNQKEPRLLSISSDYFSSNA